VRIAAFDVDSTVVDCESQVLFVRFLLEKRLAPAWLLMEVGFWFALNRLGWKLEVPKVYARLVSRFSGIPRAVLRNAIGEFVPARLKPRIRKDAEMWMSRLRAEGCHIVLLSAGIENMVALLAESMGADGYAGTKITIDRPGKISIEGEAVYGEAKMRALRDYADRKFPSWRLDYAFGNDYADRFLLSAAAHPIAVCPSARLRAWAEKEGWQSTIWR
jgi:HAD superfamily hydrolase (TIGR01490 family)